MPKPNNNAIRSELLFLHAITSLHPGCGTALGVVDLPVQRERHTGWPSIPGSTLKGVLRAYCRSFIQGKSQKDADADPDLTVAFGPPTGKGDEHAGALSFTDARIMAFPVRSLKGVFAWVSCSAVLERFGRDAALANRSLNSALPSVKSNGSMALVSDKATLTTGKDELVLEEFRFEAKGDSSALAKEIAALAVADQSTRNRFENHFVVLGDDDFSYFVQRATEVVARVGLDYETKTVKDKALFYQEFLPPECLFYSVVIATPSRNPQHQKSAAEILQYLGSGK